MTDLLTRGHWFGPSARPLLGWLTSANPRSSCGVLVLPPVGYEYWSAHRTLRTLAERLAEGGHLVLRIDYDGTGDSAGSQWDPSRVEGWRASAVAGADELRALGVQHLCVVGARLGGTFALLDGPALGAERVVAWAPILSGRRYARELRLLSVAVPDTHEPRGASSTLAFAGTVLTAETLAGLAALDLTRDPTPAAEEVLILDGDGAGAQLIARWTASGRRVGHQRVTGGESALAVPAEDATVPMEVIEAIASWIAATGPSAPRAVAPDATRPRAQLTWEGTEIVEEVRRLTDRELVGVWSGPLEDRPSAPVTVFLNSGSEPHIGSGRAWVEYARALAATGYHAVRLDFSGWGESPDLGHAPGRPYDPHCVGEITAVVRALRAQGYEKVMLVGLCASAWAALRAALTEPIDAVVALNPQFYWRPGDPVEALMSETRVRRTPTRAREELGARWRLWPFLDVLGHRPWAGAWLDGLAAAPTQSLLLFAEGDDGLEFLHNRLDRRLRHVRAGGRITVREVPEIDHSMHRLWLRGRVTEALLEHLRSVEAAGAAAA